MKREFAFAVANRYDALYNGSDDEETEPDLGQEGSQIEEMYTSTCEGVLRRSRGRKEWLSKDTGNLVEKRHELKARMEAAKTRNQKLATAHAYKNKNQKLKGSCSRDNRKKN